MACNFRLNRDQAWKLVGIQDYCENEEIVINGDSYDRDEETFDFACVVKDEAPDRIWENLEPDANGYNFFHMAADGTVAMQDREDDE